MREIIKAFRRMSWKRTIVVVPILPLAVVIWVLVAVGEYADSLNTWIARRLPR